MRNLKKIIDIPVLAVFVLTLADMDYNNLRLSDFVILGLIALNIILMAVYYISRIKNNRV